MVCSAATAGLEISRRMVSERAFFGISALLFAASAAVTIAWCASMSAMGEMPMSGGWTMSMVWMRMPGQTWPVAAASFLGMWIVMMVAMMLPSLVPMLRRYRQAVGKTGQAPARTNKTRLGRLTALVGVGYFCVWTAFGMAAFPLGVALAAIEMRQPAVARAVPIAVGVVVLIAGGLQLTAWKARHLACCREAPGRGRTLPADVGTPGGTACASASTAPTAVSVSWQSSWSSALWTFARWLSWRQSSPSNA
jgi:predicted metal-binding membrane protein